MIAPIMRLLAILISYCGVVCGMPQSAIAATGWDVQYQKSRLGFVGTQSGQAFEGFFGVYAVKVDFDPAHPEKGSLEVEVDVASAKTGDGERDQALPTPEWFSVRQFPTARFVSSAIAHKAGQSSASCYEAVGDLVLRGVSKRLTLPFCLTSEGIETRVRGNVTLMRNDFGVGQGEWNNEAMVKFSVDVVIDLVAQKKV